MLNIKLNVPKSITNISTILALEIRLGLRKAVNNISGKAKQNAPYKTGTLRRSINTRVDDNNLTGEVGTNLIYGPIQEYGGIIKSKSKPFLTFKIGNNWIRTKKVKIKGKRYLGKAFDSEKGNIKEYFNKLLKDYK